MPIIAQVPGHIGQNPTIPAEVRRSLRAIVHKPRVRAARDLASEAEAEKRHLRKLVKKFGVKIREPRRSRWTHAIGDLYGFSYNPRDRTTREREMGTPR